MLLLSLTVVMGAPWSRLGCDTWPQPRGGRGLGLEPKWLDGSSSGMIPHRSHRSHEGGRLSRTEGLRQYYGYYHYYYLSTAILKNNKV